MAGAGDVEAHMQRLVSASAAAAGDGSRPEASGLLARVGRVLGPHHYTYNAAVLTDTGGGARRRASAGVWVWAGVSRYSQCQMPLAWGKHWARQTRVDRVQGVGVGKAKES